MVCHETYKDKNNNWLSPDEVESKDGKKFYVKNQPEKEVIVGSSESMSKSKKNTIDPEDIIDNFGADASSSTDVGNLSINNVVIYPNPVNNHANIDFTLIESSIVNVTILNVLGETVKNNTYNLVTGNHQIDFDVTDVTSGVYFIQLDINGQTTTQKITVAK